MTYQQTFRDRKQKPTSSNPSPTTSLFDRETPYSDFPLLSPSDRDISPFLLLGPVLVVLGLFVTSLAHHGLHLSPILHNRSASSRNGKEAIVLSLSLLFSFLAFLPLLGQQDRWTGLPRSDAGDSQSLSLPYLFLLQFPTFLVRGGGG